MNRKKYTASINAHDADYHYSPGVDSNIQVDSWKEAQEYCDKHTSRPFTYSINWLMDNTTKKFYDYEWKINQTTEVRT